MDLSSKEREGGEVGGVWGNGEQLILQLDEGSLKLIETETGETLNCQVRNNFVVVAEKNLQGNSKSFLNICLSCECPHILITGSCPADPRDPSVGSGSGQREGLCLCQQGQTDQEAHVPCIQVI